MKDAIQAETSETMKIDLVGPWNTNFNLSKKSKSIYAEVMTVTIIEEGVSFVETWPRKNKLAANAVRVTDMMWFCKIPRSKRCHHGIGGKLFGTEF